MDTEPVADPVSTDPDLYRVIFENARVRVLEYLDRPGTRTHEHHHPDSVAVTLSAFHRLVTENGQPREVDLDAHRALWLPAQDHTGENIGGTPTHVIFVELK